MDPVPSNSTALGAVAMQVTVGVMSVCESTSPLCACSSGYALCSRHVFCLTISVSPAPSALSPSPYPRPSLFASSPPSVPIFLSVSWPSISLHLCLILYSSLPFSPSFLPVLSSSFSSSSLSSLSLLPPSFSFCLSLSPPPHRLYFFLYLISRFPVTQLQ